MQPCSPLQATRPRAVCPHGTCARGSDLTSCAVPDAPAGGFVFSSPAPTLGHYPAECARGTPASASNPRAVASEPTGSPGRQALPVLAVSLLEHAAHRLRARSALFIRGIGTWSSSCWSQLAARSGATGGSGPVHACRLFQGGCGLPDAYFPGSPAGLPGTGMIYL